MTTTSEVQVIPDPALSAFATLCRRHDFFYSYSDDARAHRAGDAEEAELVRVGRTLPRADVLVIVELMARRHYGNQEWWSKTWDTDPVPRYVAAFAAQLDRIDR